VLAVAEPAMVIVDADYLAAGKRSRPLQRVSLDDVAKKVQQALTRARGSSRTRPRNPTRTCLFFHVRSTGPPRASCSPTDQLPAAAIPAPRKSRAGQWCASSPLFSHGRVTISLQQWQARDLVGLRDEARRPGCVACHPAVRPPTGSIRCRQYGSASSTRSMRAGVGGDGHCRSCDSRTAAHQPPTGIAGRDCGGLSERVDPHLYGSTEAGNVSSLTGPDVFRKPNSCGVPSRE